MKPTKPIRMAHVGIQVEAELEPYRRPECRRVGIFSAAPVGTDKADLNGTYRLASAHSRISR